MEHQEHAAAYLAFATDAARRAGAILRDRFGLPHDVEYKGAVDMVTEADKASEALIVGMIRAAYPDHDVLGEEGARGDDSDSPLRWVIDPLDGTTNFAHNLPIFCVSIGLMERGVPLVGVVYDPMRDELFAAVRGAGATLNGQPIRASRVDRMLGALLVTGFVYDMTARARQAHLWRVFMTRVQSIRQTGSAALNLCYVGAGRLDGFWERGLAPWDVAAGALVLAEAGGVITDFEGGPFTVDGGVLLAAAPGIHHEMLALIAEHGEYAPATADPANRQRP
ncbi:MAG: inositol monophosphatase [Thermomicrobiales bacterium]|nr:inositol monophosphatase [Thermomicrobiales bacterium]